MTKDTKETITIYFETDHARLDGLFKQYQANKRSNFSHAKECFKQFKFGLERHIVWEEEILFPFFESKTGATQSGPAAVMRREHLEIKDDLEKIHKKVRRKDLETDVEEGELIRILEGHNCKEEQILYPLIDQLTSEMERQEIFSKIRNLPEERHGSCCGGH